MLISRSYTYYLVSWGEMELTLVKDSDFCKRLGIDRKTSFNWRKKKLLPHLRIGGKVYYRMSHIIPFLCSPANFNLRMKVLKSEPGIFDSAPIFRNKFQ